MKLKFDLGTTSQVKLFNLCYKWWLFSGDQRYESICGSDWSWLVEARCSSMDDLKEAVELCHLASLGDTDIAARKTQIQMQTVEGQDIKSTFPLSSVSKHVKREEKGLHFLLAWSFFYQENENLQPCDDRAPVIWIKPRYRVRFLGVYYSCLPRYQLGAMEEGFN